MGNRKLDRILIIGSNSFRVGSTSWFQPLRFQFDFLVKKLSLDYIYPDHPSSLALHSLYIYFCFGICKSWFGWPYEKKYLTSGRCGNAWTTIRGRERILKMWSKGMVIDHATTLKLIICISCIFTI